VAAIVPTGKPTEGLGSVKHWAHDSPSPPPWGCTQRDPIATTHLHVRVCLHAARGHIQAAKIPNDQYQVLSVDNQAYLAFLLAPCGVIFRVHTPCHILRTCNMHITSVAYAASSSHLFLPSYLATALCACTCHMPCMLPDPAASKLGACL
jgi:hypothetical protein